MKSVVAAALSGLVAAGCAAQGNPVREMAAGKAPYVLQGDYVEACECESVCQCAFTNDATFDTCRATVAWHVEKGRHGDVDLKGLTFAIVMTDLGKNIAKNQGNYEGVLYLPEDATPAQKAALSDFVDANLRPAFKKQSLKTKTARIAFKKDGEKRQVTIGKVDVMKTAPLAGAGGAVPAIHDSTIGLIPVEYCGKAEVHTFNDEGIQWDFAGRNSFYGPFHYVSKR